MALDTLLEGCGVNWTLFTHWSPVHELRTFMNNCSGPWDRKPDASYNHLESLDTENQYWWHKDETINKESQSSTDPIDRQKTALW